MPGFPSDAGGGLGGGCHPGGTTYTGGFGAVRAAIMSATTQPTTVQPRKALRITTGHRFGSFRAQAMIDGTK